MRGPVPTYRRAAAFARFAVEHSLVLPASALVALCHPGAGWVTGNVINVDGGEEVSAG